MYFTKSMHHVKTQLISISANQSHWLFYSEIHGRWISVSSPGPWHAAHITLVANFVHQSTIHLVRRYESFRKLLISLGHLVLKKFHNILHHLPEFRYLYFQWDRLLVIINVISVFRHSLKTRVLALVRQFAPYCSRLTCQDRTLFLAHIPVADQLEIAPEWICCLATDSLEKIPDWVPQSNGLCVYK